MLARARPDWIAVDWGTTHLRAYAIAGDDRVLAQTEGPGLSALAGQGGAAFEAALLSAIAPWLTDGQIKVVMCGMVGSRQGWLEAPYVAVPAALSELFEQKVSVPCSDPRLQVTIVPGMAQRSPDDVMRGEETQLLGALNDMTHQSIVCLPGTHSKWVHLTGLQINRFSTAMTGELFSLLRKQSILRHSIGKTDELHLSTFRDAVRRSAAAPEELMTALFEVRAAGLLNPGAVDYAFSTLSGLLLGAEFSSALSSDVEHVVLVGDPELTRIYAAGLEAIGVSSTQKDGAVAAVRGLSSVLGSLKLPSKVSV